LNSKDLTHPPLKKGGLGGFVLCDDENPPKSPFVKGGLKGNCLFLEAFAKAKRH